MGVCGFGGWGFGEGGLGLRWIGFCVCSRTFVVVRGLFGLIGEKVEVRVRGEFCCGGVVECGDIGIRGDSVGGRCCCVGWDE